MDIAYYPGCSLTGSARRLDKGIRRLFTRAGHVLKEIPDWNCCGAFEYGKREELLNLSKSNLAKAAPPGAPIVAPCPACYKNMKEASLEQKKQETGNRKQETGTSFSAGSNSTLNTQHSTLPSVVHPLELFDDAFIDALKITRSLDKRTFFPYYGCILARPKETAIGDLTVMERVIERFGGKVSGESMKDRCCGGNQFFISRSVTEKLSTIILTKTEGIIVLFCPLCHMALTSFAENRRIIYFTDLLLYLIGERQTL